MNNYTEETSTVTTISAIDKLHNKNKLFIRTLVTSNNYLK